MWNLHPIYQNTSAIQHPVNLQWWCEIYTQYTRIHLPYNILSNYSGDVKSTPNIPEYICHTTSCQSTVVMWNLHPIYQNTSAIQHPVKLQWWSEIYIQYTRIHLPYNILSNYGGDVKSTSNIPEYICRTTSCQTTVVMWNLHPIYQNTSALQHPVKLQWWCEIYIQCTRIHLLYNILSNYSGDVKSTSNIPEYICCTTSCQTTVVMWNLQPIYQNTSAIQHPVKLQWWCEIYTQYTTIHLPYNILSNYSGDVKSTPNIPEYICCTTSCQTTMVMWNLHPIYHNTSAIQHPVKLLWWCEIYTQYTRIHLLYNILSNYGGDVKSTSNIPEYICCTTSCQTTVVTWNLHPMYHNTSAIQHPVKLLWWCEIYTQYTRIHLLYNILSNYGGDVKSTSNIPEYICHTTSCQTTVVMWRWIYIRTNNDTFQQVSAVFVV